MLDLAMFTIAIISKLKKYDRCNILNDLKIEITHTGTCTELHPKSYCFMLIYQLYSRELWYPKVFIK